MESKKKIGILTLPLHTNYGGNLQAYALMTVLKTMGHEVWLINRQHNIMPAWKYPFAIIKRIILKFFLLKKNIEIFREIKQKKRYPIISQFTQPFLDKYISPQTRSFHSSNELTTGIDKYNFDVIVVGSDQVWRVAYAPTIEDYFLGFINKDKIKKVSYAASFGTSDWEFSKESTEKCGMLLKNFDAVSVRETDGVKLCQERFQVEAEHVLDPTMLLVASDYMKLVDPDYVDKHGKELLVYFLDSTSDKETVISGIEKKYNYKSFKVNSKTEQKDKDCLDVKELIAPPIESWIAGFADAKFVVTDSFHACVFSILFNKPFVVYGNENRGLSRFTSLLQMFKLEERLIYSSTQLDQILSRPINWENVNATLEAKRKTSTDFLAKAVQ